VSAYMECTGPLVEDAKRIFEVEDILSLKTMPPFMLLDDAKRLMENMQVFRRKCYRELSREEYEHFWSIYNGALLKLSVALDEAGVEGPEADAIKRMFTEEERRIVREFERFGKLDPQVTPPERLADMLVSRSGEIYELVAEAVRKQYVDFAGLIKTWTTSGRVRDMVSRVLQMRYEKRFKNIVEAVKRLLDQQPAWLLRLFTDYEKALLESAELRERIEAELREKVERELGVQQLREKLEILSEEREKLYSRLTELEDRLIAGEREKSQALVELERMKAERDRLAEKTMQLDAQLESIKRMLEEAQKALAEKEEELRRLSEQYSEDKAAKEALEAEARTLRQRVDELSQMLAEYEAASGVLATEKSMLEAKLAEIEAAIRGEQGERLVSSEEAMAYEALFMERFNYHLNSFPLTLYIPPKKREVKIFKWGKPNPETVILAGEAGPAPKTISTRYTLREGMIRKKPTMVVEAISFARPDPYKLEGYDKKPMTLAEALELVRGRAEQARSQGYYHVLILSSPTGFTDRLKNYVSGDEFHRVFLSKHLALTLFDPVTGEVYTHPADPVIKKLWDVVKPLAGFEEVEAAAKKVMELEEDALARSPSFPYYTLDELVERTGAQSEVLRAALEKLEKEGAGRIVNYKGKLVFAYNV